MRCSLILTTYNWTDALALSLTSALKQSHIPDEIIIADDGSSDETKKLIEKFALTSPIPIIHAWQEDEGFRLSKSRNEAIKKSTSEYVIVSDGDMILHPHFIKDHLRCAQKGVYVQGSRVLMDETLSQEVIKNGMFEKPSFFSKHIRNRKNALYMPFLSKRICRREITELKRIRGCNFALFKEDIESINGFNEEFNSWGREDSEFVQRLFNAGCKRKNLKFSAIQYHIHHESGNASSENDALLQYAIDKKLLYCEHGMKNQKETN